MDRIETRVTRDETSPKVEFFGPHGEYVVVDLGSAVDGDDDDLISKAKAIMAQLTTSSEDRPAHPEASQADNSDGSTKTDDSSRG